MTRALPPEALHPTGTAVLLAVVLSARPTVRSVAADVGIGVMTAHWWLRRLRADGLVSWTDGAKGTLRPLVEFVPIQRQEMTHG